MADFNPTLNEIYAMSHLEHIEPIPASLKMNIRAFNQFSERVNVGELETREHAVQVIKYLCDISQIQMAKCSALCIISQLKQKFNIKLEEESIRQLSRADIDVSVLDKDWNKIINRYYTLEVFKDVEEIKEQKLARLETEIKELQDKYDKIIGISES
jgi:hypothetical protein